MYWEKIVKYNDIFYCFQRVYRQQQNSNIFFKEDPIKVISDSKRKSVTANVFI
jgi:hypothetical protein